MAFDFNDVETGDFFSRPLSFGRLGDDHNVKPEDMPDNVSRQIELQRIVESSSFLDEDAMTKVVAHTCTAEFHKRKGYLDNDEQSALTLYQLERLYGLPEEYDPLNLNHTFRNKFISELNEKVLNGKSNALFELDEFFVLLYHLDDNIGDSFSISSDGWSTPTSTHKWGIMYILTEKQGEEWEEENRFLDDCAQMIERISAKPVVVFQAKDEIKRSNYQFTARDIHAVLNEKIQMFQKEPINPEFPVVLEFKGMFTAKLKKEENQIMLTKMDNKQILAMPKVGRDTFADVGKQLRFYVYLLAHPDTHKIFYVGKGENDRVFSHEKDVIKKQTRNEPIVSKKEKIIADIIKSGKSPIKYIVRYNLNEDEAFLLESVLIDLLNCGEFNLPQKRSAKVDYDSLSNIQNGHSLDKGVITTVEDLYLRKGSKELQCEDSERGYQKGRAVISKDNSINLLVAKLTNKYGEISDNNERLERTAGDWPLSKPVIEELLKDGLYIASAEGGIITAIYKVNDIKQWKLKNTPENTTPSDRVQFEISPLSTSDPVYQVVLGKNVFFNKSQFPIIYCC